MQVQSPNKNVSIPFSEKGFRLIIILLFYDKNSFAASLAMASSIRCAKTIRFAGWGGFAGCGIAGWKVCGMRDYPIAGFSKCGIKSCIVSMRDCGTLNPNPS